MPIENGTVNNTINLIENLFSNLASTQLTDTLILALIVPLGVIGSLLNLIGTIVLSRPSFRKLALYKYLRVYSLTSLIITFLMSFYFYMAPRLLFDLALSYMGRIFRCFVITNIITLFFSFGNILDILFNLERVSYFTNKKIDSLKRISPYYVCLGSLIVSVVLHIPNFLTFTLAPSDLISVKVCIFTPFANSPVGKILLLTSSIFQGPVILLFVIITNTIAYIAYKSFLLKKKTAININQQQTDQLGPFSTLPINSSQQKIKKQKEEKKQKKLVQMTLWISTFSVFIHIIQFSSQFLVFVLQTTVSSDIYALFLFLYSFIMVLKHFSSIFFFYKFNNNFKKSIHIFCLSQLTTKSDYNANVNRQPINQIQLASLSFH
jgi:hypothetical protein